MNTWKRIDKSLYRNFTLGIEVYRAYNQSWYARSVRNGTISGPHATMRDAKLSGRELA